MLFKPKHYTYISMFKFICLLFFIHTELTHYCGGSNKTIILALIRVQNKAARTLTYELKQLFCILSTELLIFQTYFNRQLPNSSTLLITVDYLNTSVTAFLILHHSTNIKQRLLCCKNIIYPE